MTQEALKLALEALETAWYHVGTFCPTDEAIELYDDARAAIKEALAQPEQKDEKGRPMTYWGGMAQPEPVIDKSAAIRIATSLGWTPQRTWVGLTDDEQQDLYDRWVRTGDGWGLFYLLIEAKLKENNT